MTKREQQILQWIAEDPMISQEALAARAGIARSSVAVHISNLMKKGYIAGKGYVLRQADYAVVIGGVNMDIGGQSFGPLVARDSNPGAVRVSPGGVGRNIAHNMALLGLDVRMLTALGDDLYARQIAAGSTGVDLSHALRCSGCPTSTYLYLAGPDGDMALAVSDMALCERITPEYLSGRLGLINHARLVVVDANLPAQTLAWLAENCTRPMFADPVSTAKAQRLKPILGKLHTIKPNRLEAELLTGIAVDSRQGLTQAAKALLEAGVERVFLSLGSQGVYAAGDGQEVWLPSRPATLVGANGAGDAFMAGLAWAFFQGTGLEQAALAGASAAAIALESSAAINPNLSAGALQARMAQPAAKTP